MNGDLSRDLHINRISIKPISSGEFSDQKPFVILNNNTYASIESSRHAKNLLPHENSFKDQVVPEKLERRNEMKNADLFRVESDKVQI